MMWNLLFFIAFCPSVLEVFAIQGIPQREIYEYGDSVLLQGPKDGNRDFTPKHMQTLHGMQPEEREATLKNMRTFIDSVEGFATLVLMGDSTMSGLVTELLNISEEVQDSLEILYVSNDRKQKVRYGCNEACGGVAPGEEWKNETKITDELTRLTVERAEASTRSLHDASCNSGGGLETYIFRSGVYKNLVVHHWGFLPEYAQYCWKPCLSDAMAALQPTAVVWNIGFHLLNHDFNPSVCKQRHNPVKPGCSDYESLVSRGTHEMLKSGVETVIWKHTNWVCEKKQMEGFPKTTAALLKWHDVSQRDRLETVCAEECPQYKGLKCYDWFFDAHTSEHMYEQSKSALENIRNKSSNPKRIAELDAFAPTRDCCNRGCDEETDDGEHYAGLDSSLAVKLASLLAERNA